MHINLSPQHKALWNKLIRLKVKLNFICFVLFRFVSFRFNLFPFDLFRFDLFRFVSICFVLFVFRFALYSDPILMTLFGPFRCNMCVLK